MGSFIEVAALAVLGFWILLSLDRARRWPRDRFLDAGGAARSPESGPGAVPDVAAIVPARDEAAVLPRTLPALLSQDLPRWRVILADDGSRDGTAERAREIARLGPFPQRLQVLSAPAAPPGWAGKVNALAAGAAAACAGGEGEGDAGPEWFLFTDADIEHRPGSARALLAKAAEGPYDLVSVMARLHAGGFWERLLIPPFVYFFNLLYPFRRVGAAESRTAAAAGGCILVRRRALEAAGGLAAIRGAVIDDVALAAAVRRSGGRLWLGFDPGIVSVRAYRGLGDIWRMVARSAFIQLRRRWDLLAAVVLAIGFFFVAPPFLAAAGLAQAILDGSAGLEEGARWFGPGGRAAAAALAAWLLGAAALLPFVRYHRAPAIYSLTLPAAALLYALMTIDSGWSHAAGRGAPWKGRVYGGEEPR